MQFRNGLALFTKMSGGGYNIASYHSPHSLTWRWIFSMSLPRRGVGRWRPIFHVSPHNSGGAAYFGFLKFGFNWHWQRPMWFRDLYHRLRDEKDFAAGQRYRGSAYKPPPPLPTVTEQNTSVH